MRLPFALTALVAAVAIAACTPADAALDGDLEIAGMEPAFWGVIVDRAAGTSAINIDFKPEFNGTAPVKSKAEDGSILLTSQTPEGDFVMKLKQESCLAGLDNKAKYDWAVSVDWKGETWTGCAKARKPAAG
jgi:uncharacterized membrane protein